MEKIWLKNYPTSVQPEIDPGIYRSIPNLFSEACQKYQSRAAFSNMGVNLSFSDLERKSTEFAAFLTNHVGLQKGDRIALQMPNLLQFPIAMFGALKAGLVVVNTNPLYTSREMLHQFNDSGAKAIVILANFANHLQSILDQTGIKTVIVTEIGDLLPWPKRSLVNFAVKYVKRMVPAFKLRGSYRFLQTLEIGSQSTFTPVELDHEDLAFLQYTGGTTGVSKGAMLTHKNIISNMLQIYEWMNSPLDEAKEIAVTALPLYHIFSLTVNCLSFMKNGSTNLLITNPKDIPGFIKILRTNRYTIFTGVNTLFNALMNHPDFSSLDFSDLKVSVAGGMA